MRDYRVTGVQTCALPISLLRSVTHRDNDHATASHYLLTGYEPTTITAANETPSYGSIVAKKREIGRAACRGRGEISGVAGSFKKKTTDEHHKRTARKYAD